jgi:AraC family transcriptional regulator, regulatory protein of adaptative response / DNA-3-methyladenine glycosylase II
MAAILGLDRRALDRARVSRDPRFDGKFFIAVTSTGIYCRPICPSPTSKSVNVRYYATAAAAAEAGFRPCLRCRPEAAPGTPAWLGTSAVVRRALRLIDDGLLDAAPVGALAARLGIGVRHLHRLFVQHVGASPIAVAQTRRLHFAKRLLDDTDLPMTEVALAAGFGSLRRFNDAFQSTYGRAPRELRRQRRGGQPAEGSDEVVLRLAFRPPYDWPAMCDQLAARATPGVERIDERGYARTVPCDGGIALVQVRPLAGEDALELRVRGAAPAALFHISSTVRRVFDLSADPTRIAAAFAADPLLAPLVAARPGLRVAGAWDAFECAIRLLLGAEAGPAARGLARLVVGLRRPAGTDRLTHVFPAPAELASARLDRLGLSERRAGAVHALARALAGGSIDPSGAIEEVASAFALLPGFDSSRAQIVAMRGLGDPDAFPAADPVLRRIAGGGVPLGARALAERAEAWRPWRAYAAAHLWRAAAVGRAHN